MRANPTSWHEEATMCFVHSANGGPVQRAAIGEAAAAVLPEAGIYKPIWEYDAKTLASDLSGHLAYGAGTGVTFWLLAKAL
jgi:hypothetical protein